MSASFIIGLALVGLGLTAASWLTVRGARRARAIAAAPAPAPAAPPIAHGVLDEAMAHQAAHELVHPVKYTPHQRRRAVHRRALELAHLRGQACPPELEQLVRARVPIK